jgi:hypothetical protein
VLFEEVLVELDSWGLESGRTALKWFRTPVVNRTIGRMAAGGSPNPVLPARGVSMTEDNLYAVYTSVESGETPLEAFGVYGIPSIRPFTVNFTLPSSKAITRRVCGVRGTMAVYVAAGATLAGTQMNVFINTQAAPGSINYFVPLESVYNSDQDVFVKVGEVDVGIIDFGFTLGGIIADLELVIP